MTSFFGYLEGGGLSQGTLSPGQQPVKGAKNVVRLAYLEEVTPILGGPHWGGSGHHGID